MVVYVALPVLIGFAFILAYQVDKLRFSVYNCAFMGSYFLIRGISFFTGGWPPEQAY